MMTEDDIKSMGLVLSIGRCIKITKDIIESTKDKLKHARSCTSKKNYKHTVSFYEAVCYHLERLEKMDSEIKNG